MGVTANLSVAKQFVLSTDAECRERMEESSKKQALCGSFGP